MKKIFYFLTIALLFSCKIEKKVATTDPKEDEKPNILYIAVDDMNRWVGAMGGQAKTPNIDRLAKQGMLFTNAHTVVPACNPSRVAIMTGLRPETTGQYTNQGNFREKPGNINRITMPQYLRQNGYETVATGKIFHQPRGKSEKANPLSDPESWSYQPKNLVGTKGHQMYLDEYDQASWLNGAMRKEGPGKTGASYISKFGVWGTTPEAKEETNDWKNAQFTADYLSKTHEKPFFMACGIFRPHSPQIAPKEFFDMYPLDSVKVHDLPNEDMLDIPKHIRKNFSSEFVGHVKAKGQLQKAIQGYLASMSFADACIGQILDGLENGPNKENTIVVLWTDHGWQLGHKDRWEKFSLWDIATNTPLIIKHPKEQIAGTKIDQPVSLLDLYPTLMDFIGLEKPKDLEGTSLAPFVADVNYKRKEPVLITFEKGNQSIRKNAYNYIRYANGKEELYDHRSDKMEYTNLAEQKAYQETKTELRQLLNEIN